MENKKIGILGVGTMGSQISVLFARNGFIVKVWDIKDEKSVDAMFKKVSPETRANIHYVKNLEELNDVDFIEECLIESFEIKKNVFNHLGRIIGKDVVLATNTSSLSIMELSKHFIYPENFIGVHFFNPVDSIDIVEVVYTPKFSNLNRERTKMILETIKRKIIYVSDSPGFIVNRLLIPMINEAAKLLEENVASATDIDKAMRLGAKHPLGPLTLADLIGLDVCLAIMQNLNSHLSNEYYKVSTLLKNLVSNGFLGRKTKKGFYDY